MSYQDYLEQLTFLLFLKMADERARLTGEAQPIPAGYRWADLAAPQMEGVELEQHYRETLRVLGLEGGMLGLIFEKAQNKIQYPSERLTPTRPLPSASGLRSLSTAAWRWAAATICP